ncbi:nucleoside-diphosphate-sugar epimerase [Glycomyces artemisiae]|uniref:Nucleoside-diphosphate-sugar epimerase n=1 Tax=Glycomyces artemisiae TaxID=1076443 RepID=A0A2T0UHN3_9ACTN|nr:nucleoside-diphosphate-sugar epimerase [Glycomyces artemisiae]
MGGTGAVGGATALRLARAGWDVAVTGRDPKRMPAKLTEAGVRFRQVERGEVREVGRLVGDGVDLLVDLVAYTGEDVAAILPVMGVAACPVVVSGRAVYVDREGRDLNGAQPPRFDGPLTEDGPTLAPAPPGTDPFTREGYGPCKSAAERVALDSGLPVTVLRPSKVHGRWARNPRTLTVIERMRSDAERFELANGDVADHLSAASNVAALIEVVASKPEARIVNAADPDTPTAEAIVRAVAAEIAWEGAIVRTDDAERGRHPWRTAMVLDMTAALELGYRPVGTGIELLPEEVRWVASRSAGR